MNTQNTNAQAEQQIRDLEDARYQAVLDSDADAFAALAHPELSYTHSNAVVDTLETYTKALRENYYVYKTVEHPVDRIVIDGDTAMVVGEMHADILSNGEPRRLDSKVIAVWLRRDGQWKLLAFQPTAIPKS